MGSIINTIITNDLLFYGIIAFLIVAVIILFIYLHHKNIISMLEEEIEFTKIEDEKIADSLSNLAEVSQVDSKIEIIEKQIDELDGKLAIEKILNEDENVSKSVIESDISKQQLEKKESEPVFEKSKTLSENIVKDKVQEISDEPKSELELMLEKMQHDLEEQKEKDAVAIFEQEQEEKSIISYKELLEKKNELMSMAEVFSDERFENEPTIIDSNDETLSENYTAITNNINDSISIDLAKEENKDTSHKKFVTTDFISPVFGRREARLDYPKVPNFRDMMIKKEKTNEYDLEATLNLEPLTEQMKKDDAFLNALKEFRKNLE